MGAIWAPWGAKYKDEMDKCGEELGKKFEQEFKVSFEKKDKKE